MLLETFTEIEIMKLFRMHDHIILNTTIHLSEHYCSTNVYKLLDDKMLLFKVGNIRLTCKHLAEHKFIKMLEIEKDVHRLDITFAGLWALWLHEHTL
jgi:hypothetical protein